MATGHQFHASAYQLRILRWTHMFFIIYIYIAHQSIEEECDEVYLVYSIILIKLFMSLVEAQLDQVWHFIYVVKDLKK